MFTPFLWLSGGFINIKFVHYNYIPLFMQSYNTVPVESTQDALATSEQTVAAQNLAAAIRPAIDHHSQQVAKQFSAAGG